MINSTLLSGRTDQVAKLLEDDNKDLPDTRTKRTPLIWAVVGDHPDTVRENTDYIIKT